jgi:hypothetical protein
LGLLNAKNEHSKAQFFMMRRISSIKIGVAECEE